jgi:hypothetical protein
MNSKKLRLKTNKVILKYSITEMKLIGRDRKIQETLYLTSIPGMKESILEGMAEPIEKCATDC